MTLRSKPPGMWCPPGGAALSDDGGDEELLRSCTLMYDLYKITEASTLKKIKRRVFEVFKDDLEWQTRSGAFKTVDCKKMNQVKLRA